MVPAMDRERWSIWTRCSHNHSDREPVSASITPRSSTPLTAPVSLSPQRTIYSSTVVLCQLCFCNEKGQFGVALQRKSKERDFVRIDGTQCLYFTSNSPQKKFFKSNKITVLFTLQVHATILLCASPAREEATKIPGTVAGADVPMAGPEPTAND